MLSRRENIILGLGSGEECGAISSTNSKFWGGLTGLPRERNGWSWKNISRVSCEKEEKKIN